MQQSDKYHRSPFRPDIIKGDYDSIMHQLISMTHPTQKEGSEWPSWKEEAGKKVK